MTVAGKTFDKSFAHLGLRESIFIKLYSIILWNFQVKYLLSSTKAK